MLLLSSFYCGVTGAGELVARSQPPTDVDVRAAIERALPFVEAGGVEWIEQRECISCHRVGFMVWSQSLAATRGFDVDRDNLKERTDWSVNSLLEPQDGTPDTTVGDTNVEGVAQMILSVDAAYRASRSESYRQFVDIFRARQDEDGTWKPGGQLPAQKRPGPETRQVSTMWIALALGELGQAGYPVGDLRDKAVTAVEATESAKSTEWYAVRILLEQQSGDTDDVARFRRQLISSQHEDGGWSWITADSSDALATGQALYALSQSGLASDHHCITSAWKYLVSTQRDDGSWPVKGTKTKDKDKVVETSTYWGAAWAVMGLARSLPQ